MLDRTKTAQILQIVDVDMPVVDLLAAPAQEIGHHVLARPLRATGGRNRDEIPRGGKLGIEAGIDGIEDFFLGIQGIHGVAFPVIFRKGCVAAIKSYFAGVCRSVIGKNIGLIMPDQRLCGSCAWIAFRIAPAAIHSMQLAPHGDTGCPAIAIACSSSSAL
jgi:hypothetical protein